MTEPDKAQPLETGPALVSGRTGRGPATGRRLAVVASLAAAAVIAVLLGVIVAFQSSSNVLSPSEVAQRLAADASTAPDDDSPSSDDDASPSPDDSTAPDGSATPGASGGGAPSVLDTVAATVTVTCDGTRIAQASWSIKPDYRLDDRSQTATALNLKIESDVHDDVVLEVGCPATVQVIAQPDDHGGGNGGGGHGSGHG